MKKIYISVGIFLMSNILSIAETYEYSGSGIDTINLVYLLGKMSFYP